MQRVVQLLPSAKLISAKCRFVTSFFQCQQRAAVTLESLHPLGATHTEETVTIPGAISLEVCCRLRKSCDEEASLPSDTAFSFGSALSHVSRQQGGLYRREFSQFHPIGRRRHPHEVFPFPEYL